LNPSNPQDIRSDTSYLIDNYGMIALDELRGFAETYINQPIPTNQFDQPKIIS
jgi:hypothetical protein